VFAVRTQLHVCVVEEQRSPRNMPSGHRWETNSIALLILTSALDGVVVSATPSRYNRGKGPRYPLYRGLGRSRGRSGWVWRREDLLRRPVFEPRTLQPVVSRYTDCSVAAYITIIPGYS